MNLVSRKEVKSVVIKQDGWYTIKSTNSSDCGILKVLKFRKKAVSNLFQASKFPIFFRLVIMQFAKKQIAKSI